MKTFNMQFHPHLLPCFFAVIAFAIIAYQPVSCQNGLYSDAPDPYDYIEADEEPIYSSKEIGRYLIYPAEVEKAGISGSVLLRVLIDGGGRAIKKEVIESPHTALTEAAWRAVGQVYFTPARKNGIALKYYWLTLPPITFSPPAEKFDYFDEKEPAHDKDPDYLDENVPARDSRNTSSIDAYATGLIPSSDYPFMDTNSTGEKAYFIEANVHVVNNDDAAINQKMAEAFRTVKFKPGNKKKDERGQKRSSLFILNPTIPQQNLNDNTLNPRH